MLLLGVGAEVYRIQSILGVITFYPSKNLLEKWETDHGYLVNDNPITQNTALRLPDQGLGLEQPHTVKRCNSSQVWFPLHCRHSWETSSQAEGREPPRSYSQFQEIRILSLKRNPEKFSSDSDLYNIQTSLTEQRLENIITPKLFYYTLYPSVSDPRISSPKQ